MSICVYLCLSLSMYICLSIYVSIYLSMYVCMHAWMHACMHGCMVWYGLVWSGLVCMCVYLCLCMFIYVYLCLSMLIYFYPFLSMSTYFYLFFYLSQNAHTILGTLKLPTLFINLQVTDSRATSVFSRYPTTTDFLAISM